MVEQAMAKVLTRGPAETAEKLDIFKPSVEQRAEEHIIRPGVKAIPKFATIVASLAMKRRTAGANRKETTRAKAARTKARAKAKEKEKEKENPKEAQLAPSKMQVAKMSGLGTTKRSKLSLKRFARSTRLLIDYLQIFLHLHLRHQYRGKLMPWTQMMTLVVTGLSAISTVEQQRRHSQKKWQLQNSATAAV